MSDREEYTFELDLCEGDEEVELVFDGVGCAEEFDLPVGGRIDNGGGGINIMINHPNLIRLLHIISGLCVLPLLASLMAQLITSYLYSLYNNTIYTFIYTLLSIWGAVCQFCPRCAK